ncbi:MAG: hypothetical protein AB7N76_04465 [Planctomycetota bacterium]
MVKLLGVLLALAGAALAGVFLASGAAGLLPPAPWSADLQLGPLAGSPLLLGGGALLYLLGVALAGRRGPDDERYAGAEVFLLASAGIGLGLGVAQVLGARALWSEEVLGALLAGSLGESVVALACALKVAVKGGARKLLFVPGVLLTVVLVVFHLLVVALGAG